LVLAAQIAASASAAAQSTQPTESHQPPLMDRERDRPGSRRLPEERDGKLYATLPATEQAHAAA
jgi:hypothetical protein